MPLAASSISELMFSLPTSQVFSSISRPSCSYSQPEYPKKSDSAFNGISLHDVVFNGFKITVQVEAFADGQCSGNALERV